MFTKTMVAAGIVAMSAAGFAAAQVTFYEAPHYRGRAVTIDKETRSLDRMGFNDRASSAVVEKGRWEVCEHARFEGNCVVLRRGSYDSLASMGLGNNISSIRPVPRQARQLAEPEPLPAPTYEYRVRPNERTFEVPVSSVRAVVGPPQQRCWIEKETVSAPRGEPNVGGAVLGAVIGGVIGHQFGSGRGNDAATVGGALAGGAVGANSGRGSGTYERDVQRCASAPSGPPEFYDVTYNFRGVEHRVQTKTPPGRTLLVNGNGEPRG
jgi:uncharacterized protein YcfJ